eukprot:TRINITY_DN15857_c0_g1_i1.p1 TRINITY_DN15857_c0_g1~~TRINITY_DN15857_c0_g1_i1.p1  ORF type:complete len:332 (-),score=70.88 TRINITY_DN15857_c0_g1_i1:65-1060(-)
MSSNPVAAAFKLVQLTVKVILLAKNANEQVQFNRKKCDELMRAVGVIEGVIRQHENEISINDEQYLSVMQEIYETVNEVASFVDSHTKGNKFTQMLKGREYEVTFNRLMHRLDECLDLLQTALEHQTNNLVREYGSIKRNQIERENDELLASEANETPAAVLQQRLGVFRERILALKAELEASDDPSPTVVQELLSLQRDMVDTQKEYVASKERQEKREAIRAQRACSDCPPDIDVNVWRDLPEDIKREIKEQNARKNAPPPEKKGGWSQPPRNMNATDRERYSEHLRSAYGNSYEQISNAPPPARPPRYDYAYQPVIYPATYRYPPYYYY